MDQIQDFSVGKARFGGKDLAFILGPCVVESDKHALFMAREIKDICDSVGVAVVLKYSF
jgi:2-dehydro-3-deoxyphosphooctonate aldolase (KDO 8-P synthase)